MSPLIDAVIWAAVFGLCLAAIGARWGLWLMLPAGVAFVVWPVFHPLIHIVPIWVLLLVLPVLPVVIMILVLRAGQAVVKGIFGNDAAAFVVGHWIIALLGSFGRARRRPFPQPELPRPREAPLRPHELGGGR